MKSIKYALFSIVALSMPAFGALYTINNGSGNAASGIQTAQGQLFRGGTTAGTVFTGAAGGVSAGPGIVAIGIFSTDVFTGLNSSQIISAFTQFGTNSVAYNTAGTSGNRSIFSCSGGATTVTGSAFSNQFIYLFSGNGATLATSDQFLIVKTAVKFLDAQDSAPTPSVTAVSPSTTTLLLGTTVADIKTISTDATVTPGWQMVAVPETSTALLGALGALGLLRRRR